MSINVARLHWLLLAYYRILQANRELPRQLSWSLAPLSRATWTPHLDNAARLLSIRCYALQSGMGEEERENLEREVLGEPCGVDCLLAYGQNEDGSEKNVDGWIMPVIEVRRIQEERDSIVTKPHDYYTREDGDSAQVIQSSDLRCAHNFTVVLMTFNRIIAPTLLISMVFFFCGRQGFYNTSPPSYRRQHQSKDFSLLLCMFHSAYLPSSHLRHLPERLSSSPILPVSFIHPEITSLLFILQTPP
jgi:hypothetical protein